LYQPAHNKTISQIVAMDSSPTSGFVVTWWSDMTVSEGNSDDLDYFRPAVQWILPGGKAPADVVGITMEAGNRAHYYYRDGTRSIGSITRADLHGMGTYVPAQGFSTSQIVEMARAPVDGRTFVWYNNHALSVGTDTDLDAHVEAW
jgi:hypothetical protein